MSNLIITTELTRNALELNQLDALVSLQRGDYARVERCLNNIKDILESNDKFKRIPIPVYQDTLNEIANFIISKLKQKGKENERVQRKYQ